MVKSHIRPNQYLIMISLMGRLCQSPYTNRMSLSVIKIIAGMLMKITIIITIITPAKFENVSLSQYQQRSRLGQVFLNKASHEVGT